MKVSIDEPLIPLLPEGKQPVREQRCVQARENFKAAVLGRPARA